MWGPSHPSCSAWDPPTWDPPAWDPPASDAAGRGPRSVATDSVAAEAGLAVVPILKLLAIGCDWLSEGGWDVLGRWEASETERCIGGAPCPGMRSKPASRQGTHWQPCMARRVMLSEAGKLHGQSHKQRAGRYNAYALLPVTHCTVERQSHTQCADGKLPKVPVLVFCACITCREADKRTGGRLIYQQMRAGC